MAAPKKESNLNVRIKSDDLALIRRAAETCGKSLSSFVIEAATLSAQKELLNQRFLHLDAVLFDEIAETLSRPAKVHPELAKLLRNGSQWATSEQ